MAENSNYMYSADDETRFNLVLLRRERKILLGRKTRGFGQGLYVMPGGKNEYFIDGVQLGFRPPQYDATREVKQETGISLDPTKLEQVAELEIFDRGRMVHGLKTIQVFEGYVDGDPDLQPSDEFDDMKWIDYADLDDITPYDYQLWLPRVIGGQAVRLSATTSTDDGIVTLTSLRTRLRQSDENFEIVDLDTVKS